MLKLVARRPASGQLRQRRPIVRARPQPRRLSVKERERLLDEALLESFPASDPVSSLEFS
ncbi:MAG TPA: hypothetical protein VNS22_23325 [Geminicoccus sp.]|uniref:hypothetical protein n=1 Tax=Geminicoccus sp. TaxID=2024832 RepID=UPI002CEA41AB|nr:hypothetical protein [Geminicoccus sp.]HWL71289.1 hypothetical protein [Geminicoccus sp.]